MMFYSPVPPSASSALKGNIQQGSNIPIRNCEAGLIDRSGERRYCSRRQSHAAATPPSGTPGKTYRAEPRRAAPRLTSCLEKITAPHLMS
jgi:hypothetical protein